MKCVNRLGAMPACSGTPNGPCPYKATGSDVHFNYAELDLCNRCEKEHRDAFNSMKNNETEQTLVKQQTEKSKPHQTVRSLSQSVVDSVCGPISGTIENKKVLIQPLLSYMVFSLQSGSVANVRSAILGKFTEPHILEAKDALWHHCGTQIIGEKIQRKNSTVRSAADAHLHDILTAWAKLDQSDKCPLLVINALSLNDIPRSHPEELNNITLLDRLNRLEAKISTMQENMDSVFAENFEIKDRLQEIGSFASRVKHGPTKHTQGNQGFVLSDVSGSQKDLSSNLGTSTSVRGKAGTRKVDTVVSTIVSDPSNSMTSKVTTEAEQESRSVSEEFSMPSYVLKQQRRRENKSKRNIIKGNAKSSTLRGAPEPSRDIFVYRVDPETECETLKNHLESVSLTVRHIKLMSREESQFRSFKVTIPASQLTSAFDCEKWPEGICVRRFYESRGNQHSKQPE